MGGRAGEDRLRICILGWVAYEGKRAQPKRCGIATSPVTGWQPKAIAMLSTDRGSAEGADSGEGMRASDLLRRLAVVVNLMEPEIES